MASFPDAVTLDGTGPQAPAEAKRRAARNALRYSTDLPRSNVVALFGDSRVALGWQASANGGATTLVNNWGAWLEFLSDQRIRIPSTCNFGVSGDRTANMLARVDAVIASCIAQGVGTVIILGSTNDSANGNSYAESTDNLDQIAAKFHQANIVIIWVAETPRGEAGNGNPAAPLSGNNLRHHMAMRQWFLDRRVVPGEYAADPWPMMADQTNGSGYAAVTALQDGIHFGGVGASLVAESLLPVINFLYPFPPADILGGNADIWSAIHSKGCPIANPGLAGTDGSLPTSWSESTIPAGLTGNKNFVARGLGGRWFQTVYSGTISSGTEHENLRQDIVVGGNGLEIGQAYELYWPVQWDSGLQNIAGIELSLLSNGQRRRCLNNNDPTTFKFPLGAKSGTMRSDRFVIPVGGTTLRVSGVTRFVGNAATAGTVRWGAPALRPVT